MEKPGNPKAPCRVKVHRGPASVSSRMVSSNGDGAHTTARGFPAECVTFCLPSHKCAKIVSSRGVVPDLRASQTITDNVAFVLDRVEEGATSTCRSRTQIRPAAFHPLGGGGRNA